MRPELLALLTDKECDALVAASFCAGMLACRLVIHRGTIR